MSPYLRIVTREVRIVFIKLQYKVPIHTQGTEEFNGTIGAAKGPQRRGGGLSHPPAMSSMARVKTTHLGVVTTHLQL